MKILNADLKVIFSVKCNMKNQTDFTVFKINIPAFKCKNRVRS